MIKMLPEIFSEAFWLRECTCLCRACLIVKENYKNNEIRDCLRSVNVYNGIKERAREHKAHRRGFGG